MPPEGVIPDGCICKWAQNPRNGKWYILNLNPECPVYLKTGK